jgi:hypothetical protein
MGTWLAANWQSVAVAILAIDAALIPLFPKVGIFVSIKNFLTGIVPPAK